MTVTRSSLSASGCRERCSDSEVGAALAVSGALMQGLFRNPLADPGLVGVSSGAGLAAAATIVLGDQLLVGLTGKLPFAILPFGAFLGGLAATLASTRSRRAMAAPRWRPCCLPAWRSARSPGRSRPARLLVGRSAIARSRLLVDGQPQWRDLEQDVDDRADHPAAADRRAVAGRGLNGLAFGEAEAFHLGVRVQPSSPRRSCSSRSRSAPAWRRPASSVSSASWRRTSSGWRSGPTIACSCRSRCSSAARCSSAPISLLARSWRRRNCRRRPHRGDRRAFLLVAVVAARPEHRVMTAFVEAHDVSFSIRGRPLVDEARLRLAPGTFRHRHRPERRGQDHIAQAADGRIEAFRRRNLLCRRAPCGATRMAPRLQARRHDPRRKSRIPFFRLRGCASRTRLHRPLINESQNRNSGDGEPFNSRRNSPCRPHLRDLVRWRTAARAVRARTVPVEGRPIG